MSLSNLTKSSVTKLYEQVASDIPTLEMQSIVYDAFDEFWRLNHKKSVAEKCVEFSLLRQLLLSSFELPNDDSSYADIGNTVLDYIDMTFSYLFFNGMDGKCALEKRVDNEFYFCLLTFALDRIEFPSLVMEQIRSSFYSKNRIKINLKRRNYLATLIVVARKFTNGLIAALANQNLKLLSYKTIRKYYKANLGKLISSVGNAYDKSQKYLETHKVGNGYKLYRGYEIDSEQDVILNRRLRLQDANKSVSFTTERQVAERFATYRHSVTSSPTSTSFDDRLTLAKTMFSEVSESYERTEGKKSIVSEYVISEEDIVLCPVFTTITECEVFAFPEKARLTRYTITYSH